MSALDRTARLLRSARRGTPAVAGALVAYVLASMILGDRTLPTAVLSPPGVALGMGLVVLLLARGAEELLDRGAPASRRAAGALLWAGLALALLGPPASVVTRRTELLQVGEHEDVDPAGAPGLGPLRFGRITVAPRSDGWLLSKTVSIEAARPGEPPFEVGLWPPATVGGWRLVVLRYGFAPEIEWRDGSGRPLAEGFAMIGTFPRTEEEARLVRWAPRPRLMLGVGFFPPTLEDLLTPPGSPYHLFLRLDGAVLSGVRRDLRDPEAYRWLADGRVVDPVWTVEVFRNAERLGSAQLRAGESAAFDDGRIRVGETTAWVEIQAVWDPFRSVAWGGAGMIVAGALLRLVARRRAARPRP